MGTTTTLEREIKLRFDSVERARAAIETAGATPMLGRRLQEDALLDDEDETLRRRGCALRIRSENGKSRITFKGPIQASAMKLRDEFETVVGDGAHCSGVRGAQVPRVVPVRNAGEYRRGRHRRDRRNARRRIRRVEAARGCRDGRASGAVPATLRLCAAFSFNARTV